MTSWPRLDNIVYQTSPRPNLVDAFKKTKREPKRLWKTERKEMECNRKLPNEEAKQGQPSAKYFFPKQLSANSTYMRLGGENINQRPPKNIVLCISVNRMLWSEKNVDVYQIIRVLKLKHIFQKKRGKTSIIPKNSLTVSSH